MANMSTHIYRESELDHTMRLQPNSFWLPRADFSTDFTTGTDYTDGAATSLQDMDLLRDFDLLQDPGMGMSQAGDIDFSTYGLPGAAIEHAGHFQFIPSYLDAPMGLPPAGLDTQLDPSFFGILNQSTPTWPGFASTTTSSTQSPTQSQLDPPTPVSFSPSPTSPTSQKPQQKAKQDKSPPPPHHFPCRDCPRSFPKQHQLDTHSKRHSKPYPCPLPSCSKPHGAKRDLHRHLWTHHPAYAALHAVPNEFRECHLCGKVQRGDNMVRHLRTQHEGGGGK